MRADATREHAPTDDELSLAELIRTIDRHRHLLLLAVFLAGLGAFGFLAIAKPIYEARALLIIEPSPAARGGSTVASASQTLDSASVDSQVQILASRSLAGQVVSALALEQAAELQPPERAAWLTRLLPMSLAEEAPVPSAADPVAAFMQRLSVRREGKSHVIGIVYRSDDPMLAAQVANKVGELYMQGQLDRKIEAGRRSGDLAAARLQILEAELRQAEQALAEHRAATASAHGDGLVASGAEIADVSRTLIAVSAERSGKEAQVGVLRRLLSDAEAGEGHGEGVGSTPLLDRLSALKAELLRREAELAASFGARHPQMIDLQMEKAELDARIAQERQGLLRLREGELAQARAREKALQESLDALKGKAQRQEEWSGALAELEEQVALKRRLYEAERTRSTADADPVDLAAPDARVISEAVAPREPVFPKPKLVVSLALTSGLLVGLGLVYAAEVRATGFRSAAAVEQLLRLPVLAAVPWLEPHRLRGLTPQDYVIERPRSRYAEAMRGVLAVLPPRPAATAPATVLLVTSALPDEGKSTFVLSLARIAAGEGLRVIVVDGDLRRPVLHDYLGMAPGPGLAEVLRREVPLREAIGGDPRSAMRLLPGSPRGAEQPSRLLGPDGLGTLLAALRPVCDLVILDSAPLVAVVDARLMAKLADQIVFLVRHASTPRAVCEAAVQEVKDAGASIAGVVLSRVDLRAEARAGRGEAGFAQASLKAYYVD